MKLSVLIFYILVSVSSHTDTIYKDKVIPYINDNYYNATLTLDRINACKEVHITLSGIRLIKVMTSGSGNSIAYSIIMDFDILILNKKADEYGYIKFSEPIIITVRENKILEQKNDIIHHISDRVQEVILNRDI